MIFPGPYHTTAGSIVDIKPTEKAILEAFITTDLGYSNLGVSPIGDITTIFVTGLEPDEGRIPLFTHPISVAYRGSRYIVSDVRMYVNLRVKGVDYISLNEANDIYRVVRNQSEFEIVKSRAIFQAYQEANGTGFLRRDLGFAATVYANLLSETIGRVYALDFGEQLKVTILTHLFYQSLTLDEFDNDTKDRMVALAASALGNKATDIYTILDRIDNWGGIETYVDNVKKVVESDRLRTFNVVALLTMIGNAWYGTNAKDMIKVAVEHPVTWCSIVYAALTERSYKSSTIYRIAERLSKRGAGDMFKKNYASLVGGALSTESIPAEPELEFRML